METKYRGIFGSPAEPLFNDEKHGVPPDILKEWLVNLDRKNTICAEKSNIKQGFFYRSDAITFIFNTCAKLEVPIKVKYYAVELFERFMTKHVQDLYNHMKTTSSKTKQKDWNEVLDRVQNQLLLRLVSCCQIASKITSHYKVISAKKAKYFLRDLGLKYSSTSILQSELRVLKTLDFNVMETTPLVYMETILEILGYNDPSMSVKSYHAVALKVLDVVYLKNTQVYQELFLVIAKQTTPSISNRAAFIQVKCDKMFLAISVLTAAVYIVDQPMTDKVIDHLNKITKRPCDDILDFATVIVQSVIEGSVNTD
ncbi:cyclin N-terminal domain-containing protein 1 isoform X1 [Patella vulgata]|uniref:cyclin N-terminal domain-containing protein 1 isoform X1 n=1 Tax=Patella vulgata TaxID=6465 RepID=UPI00217FA2F5|nr:cyclin N-terminal domain-containing protein 1 isoform X1 [Patella vulgata]